ncbi:hypothetical protein LVJ94_35345 [Pendulispora rubella]|uniref:Uncharacterized protein n=1 Tax=Pendulispora rubella TaxID=2741070 RepID=A0ABZ2KTZ5_9BACT
MSAKSLLFSGLLPYSVPPSCAPQRTEVPVTVRKHGRLYRLVLRDKITVEDPYLVLVKAAIFAIRSNEPYMGRPPTRSVRDFLIRSSVVV